MKLTLTQTPGRREWTLLAGLGLFVPALLALLRVFVLRHTILGLLGGGFVPFAGPVHGIEPSSFYLVMHDLTHPLLLIGYATAFVCLPFYLRATVSRRQCNLLLFLGIFLFHFTFFCSYFGSLFLPVGDMVEIIKP